MKAQYTLGPLFVRNDEPHRIKIVDAQGNVVFSESRCAWSSNDKTVEDTMLARGFTFKGADRDAAIEANERQLADAHLRAAAPELLQACIRARMAMAAAAEKDATFQKEYELLDAAISKAKGGAA